MDFALILFLLVLVTGVISALDRWRWAGQRARAAQTGLSVGARNGLAGQIEKEPVYVEYARAFFPVILVVFLLRSFVVEPFRIPSGSMLPSLYIGDFILVNKFAYGLRLPIVNLKVVTLGEPQRGEVVVFRFPGDESVNYIKRIVGLPGDRISYQGKKIYINGALMEQAIAEPSDAVGTSEFPRQSTRLTEHLGVATHDIFITDRPDHTPSEFTVPPGQYFVMGDNRDHSNDSRFWGPVPERNLVGKAFLIWFSWDMSSTDKWLWQRVVADRIGNVIR